jgi:hypothetical protein
MVQLKLWEDYGLEAIHDIFSPDTAFLSRRGPWGQWGIIKVPNRPGDYLFLVTFGQAQGQHVFDESIDSEGVLTWQSQPQQSLKERRILDFINHDERVNTIHLFLRTRRTNPYTYLGPLGYLRHDATRERPVHFQWQLLEWPPPSGLATRIGLNVVPAFPEDRPAPESHDELTFTEPPPGPSRRGASTARFRGNRQPNHAERDARNRALGLAGEKLVLAYEINRLIAAGHPDLAELVSHVAEVEGDSAGYDIRSYFVEGGPMHIEVKTTRGPGQTDFFVSANELAFGQQHPESYFVYRLFNYDSETRSASAYVHRGPLGDRHDLAPTQYRVRLREASHADVALSTDSSPPDG